MIGCVNGIVICVLVDVHVCYIFGVCCNLLKINVCIFYWGLVLINSNSLTI